jgi:uncharacterized membrane protein YedE/YeeE
MLSGLIIGALLGFILQRARFCMTGGFRDIYLTRDHTLLYAFLIAISIPAVGVYFLTETGALTLSVKSISLIGVIGGSLLFGVGIILAGGCATGTWYRAAEGLIGSWIALLFYMLSAATVKYGVLADTYKEINGYTAINNSMAQTLNIPQGLLIVILVVITTFLVIKHLRKPRIKVPTLPAQRTGILHVLFEKRWHPFVAGAAVGLLAFAAWPLSSESGRIGGLGITTPSANIIQFLLTGNAGLIDWGVFLVLGIFLGSFIAAKGSKEFKWRVPSSNIIISSTVGGILMGVGAGFAGGCTIGNGLTNTSIMMWQGWLGLVFTIIGVWITSYFVYVRPRSKTTPSLINIAH